MPKRNLIQVLFNRGLNLVRPPALLRPGESYKAENVVFTRHSARQREGTEIAYDLDAGTSTTGIIEAIHRFYDLAQTGVIRKVLLMTYGGGIYPSSTEWTESTGSAGEMAAALSLPTTGGNTLYSDYAAGPVTAGSGNLKQIYQAKSWAYFPVDYAEADNASNVANVPLRLGYHEGGTAYKVFMQGLVPPADLLQADTEHQEENVPWNLGMVEKSAANNTGFGPSIAVDSEGGIHAAYLTIIQGNSDYGLNYAYGKPETQGQVPETWTIEAVVPISATASQGEQDCSIAVDSEGHPHIITTNSASDLLYYTKDKDDTEAGVWLETTIASTNNYDQPYIQVSSDDILCVVARDTTTAEAVYAFKEPSSSSWGGPAVVHGSPSANDGQRPTIALDSTDKVHIAYYDATNGDLRYAIRSTPGTGGTWGSHEPAASTDDVGSSASIAIASDDTVGILHSDVTVTNKLAQYTYGSFGSWTTEDIGATEYFPGWMGRSLAFDSADNPVAVMEKSASGVDGRNYYWKKTAGTWGSAVIDSVSWSSFRSSVVLDSDGYIHILYYAGQVRSMRYAVGILRDYHYRLTAEYDDGILGESGPSAATLTALVNPISSGATHTLALDSGTYNMTDDVTKIHVYRTTKGTPSDSRYYRAGSVSCTSGTPGSTFVDDVPDTTLIENELLDEDVFLPPKYKYGVYWRDRAVIAHTKSRDTSDDTQLDTGDNADASIHKNRLRFSRAFQPDRFPQNFFQDILPDGDSGSITGLVVNTAMDRLYVFMENDVVALADRLGDPKLALSYTYRNVANATGTPAPKSIVYASGLIFYWTKVGIEVIDGLRGRNITSESIAPLWGTTNEKSGEAWYGDRVNMTFLDDVAGVYDQKAQRIYWAYTSGSGAEHDKILCLDLKRWADEGMGDGVFSIWTGVQISTWCRFDGEGDQGEIMGGNGDGTARLTVYRMPFAGTATVGRADIIRDTGGGDGSTANPIDVSLHLAPTDVGRPDLLKSWRSMRVSGRGGTAGTVTIKSVIDEGTATSLGTTFDFSGTTEARSNSALPRTDIGVRCGLQIETANTVPTVLGPQLFELYHASLEYSEKRTKVRPHLA